MKTGPNDAYAVVWALGELYFCSVGLYPLSSNTPELQAYTASKLYLALKSDISQESLTLAATWILSEYSDIVIQGGIVDDDQVVAVSFFFCLIVIFPLAESSS